MDNFNLGLEQLMQRVDNFKEVAKEAVRPAAHAASLVFYNEVRTRALSVAGSSRLQAAVYEKFIIDSASGVQGTSAKYHISWRKGHSKNNEKGGEGQGGLKSVTFGYWLEFGRWQRYMVRTGTDGEWYTVARPESKGKPKPGRRASQAQKDAYWMPRPGGPVFHPAKSFLRAGYEAVNLAANQAAIARLNELIGQAKI